MLAYRDGHQVGELVRHDVGVREAMIHDVQVFGLDRTDVPRLELRRD
ncbi:hypothetical protein [Streptomyces sp. NPDC089915]